jgi:uncharacterized protein
MSERSGPKEERRALLRSIIERLHEGASPDEVRLQLRTLVRETEATEIAAMEQSLIDAGMPPQQIQKMCDLHAQVLREILTDDRSETIPPGHPIDTFERENAALMTRVGALRRLAAAAGDGETLARARETQRELMEVEKHYQRKEHLLFSYLERHGVSGPTQVMWGKDDEVRQALKALGAALAAGGDWRPLAEPALAALEGMVYKEEKILFPMSRRTLTEAEWGEVATQSPQYGWCLITPRGVAGPAAAPAAAPAGAIALPTGELTPEQLLGVLRTLPVELTFIDAEDRVRFFSPMADPIFPRSPAILGRKVQLCHPPKSLDMVERILADFRAGRQDVAEFWTSTGGRFVHIRYMAVRDEGGEYLGTLEVTQDATRIRALAGERRLLQYEEREG